MNLFIVVCSWTDGSGTDADYHGPFHSQPAAREWASDKFDRPQLKDIVSYKVKPLTLPR